MPSDLIGLQSSACLSTSILIFLILDQLYLRVIPIQDCAQINLLVEFESHHSSPADLHEHLEWLFIRLNNLRRRLLNWLLDHSLLLDLIHQQVNPVFDEFAVLFEAYGQYI
jgi:hypothetical protein